MCVGVMQKCQTNYITLIGVFNAVLSANGNQRFNYYKIDGFYVERNGVSLRRAQGRWPKDNCGVVFIIYFLTWKAQILDCN